jgi:hypothetical protein
MGTQDLCPPPKGGSPGRPLKDYRGRPTRAFLYLPTPHQHAYWVTVAANTTTSGWFGSVTFFTVLAGFSAKR